MTANATSENVEQSLPVPTTLEQARVLLAEKHGRDISAEEARRLIVAMGGSILPDGTLLPFPAGERCWLHCAPVCLT